MTSPVIGARDPALRGLAQHHRLRIEPAALIEQAAEPAAVVAVLLDRVLVVDAGDEPLVGDEQQRHAGRLVDAAALGLDDAVLDLVAHAEARGGRRSRWPRASAATGVLEADAVQRDRLALVETRP